MSNRYNLFTVQKGRKPLWSPEEIETMLDAAEAGELSVLSTDTSRISSYISDRFDQLLAYGIKEMSIVPMMAATLLYISQEFHDFRGYIQYYKNTPVRRRRYCMQPGEWAITRSA